MKLRMLLSLAGSDFALSRGDETERFSGAEAERLIEAAYAVAVLPPPDGTMLNPVLPLAAEGVGDASTAAEIIDAADGDGIAEAADTAEPESVTMSTETEPAIAADALVSESGEAASMTVEPADPVAEPGASTSEPMLAEDLTERAVRNPSRKRRG